METTKTLHNVSANYFFLLAFIYVAAALSLRNGLYPSSMIFLMRILDIPFMLIALTYGGSGLYLQINEGQQQDEGSAWGIVIFAICLFLFGAVTFLSFAFPSQL